MIPRLIHPVPAIIQRMNRAVTVLDPVAREPVRQVWRAGEGPGTGSESTLQAQVTFTEGAIGRPTYLPGGVEERWLGYLTVRVIDLIRAGIATVNSDGAIELGIARGDRIRRIGWRTTDVYVAWFVDEGHYPDQGGATLIRIHFKDRP